MRDGVARHADDVELVRQSPLFDESYYRRRCTGIAGDAVAHYLDEGWRADLDPGPSFSGRHYLARHADVRDGNINPLLHYLKYGRREGRAIAAPGRLAPDPTCPTDEEWQDVFEGWQGSSDGEAAVDVVVPVYKGKAETLRCIHSVLRSCQRTRFRLIVLDDCGPDPELSRALDALAERDVIELHRFERNVGFVRSSNYGMSLHPARDVVLLNSDTAVHNDWLDRLRDAAYRTSRAATVTPFSNNAELCSYPLVFNDNVVELELSDRDLDRLAAACNAGGEVEIPTGVGFCMYVRRAALDEIGDFDAEAFGRGYGEENDFCRRAVRAGWRNILAADVFVRHYGGRSFGAEKLRRGAEAVSRVEERNPGYLDAVRRFSEADPAMPWRRSLDLARLKRSAGDDAILLVSHAWGGGTERHVADLERMLWSAGRGTFRCTMDPAAPGRLAITHPFVGQVPNMPGFDVPSGDGAFVDAVRSLGIAHVHFHHFAGMPERSIEFFGRACRKAGLGYDVTLHDYMSICPRIFLVDHRNGYCGEPSVDDCDTCVQRAGSDFGKPKLAEWRETFRGFLGDARRVFVPDADVARRLSRYFPDQRFDVRSHPDAFDPRAAVSPRPYPRRANARTVAVIGAIGPHKGSELLLKCATLALEMAPELRFVVVGYTDRDAAFAGLGNTRVLGKYADADLQDILARVDPDLCWFPSIWPETYCYTLSSAFQAGLFPVAFDLGAPARRIRDAGWGHVMPMRTMLDPHEIVTRLCTASIPAPPAVPPSNVTYLDPLVSYYGFDRSMAPRSDGRNSRPAATGDALAEPAAEPAALMAVAV